MPWLLEPVTAQHGGAEIRWQDAWRDDAPGWAAFWRPLPAPPELPVRMTKLCDNALPDLVQGPIANMLMVSHRLRDLLEDFEPGYHHFLPVEIRDPRGDVLPRTHSLFKPGPGLPGAIDEIASNVTLHRLGGRRFYLLRGTRPELVWHASRIKGRHVWTDAMLMSEPCVSDAVHAEIVRQGLTGIGVVASPTGGAANDPHPVTAIAAAE